MTTPLDEVFTLDRAGRTRAEIASMLGLSRGTVDRWLGPQFEAMRKKAERDALTDLAADVRRLRALGLTHRQIADELHIGRATVHHWLHREQRLQQRRAQTAAKRAAREAQSETWEGARWANGPKVVAWFEETGLIDRMKAVDPGNDVFIARIKAWRNGGAADYYALDRILTALAVHPSQLPDEVWSLDQNLAAVA